VQKVIPATRVAGTCDGGLKPPRGATSMTDELVIQDAIDGEGMRTLHVLSLGSLEGHWILQSPVIQDGEVQLYVDELKMHHLVVKWPVREPIRGFLRGAEQIEWPMMLWALQRGDRMSEQIKVAAEAHHSTFATWPDFAWMRHLPSGVEDGMVVSLEHAEVILLEAEWVPRRCLCVGNGRSAVGSLRLMSQGLAVAARSRPAAEELNDA